MKWLLIIPAIPAIAWLGLWVLAWFQPPICLHCGHVVPFRLKPRGWDSCPDHGEDFYNGSSPQ